MTYWSERAQKEREASNKKGEAEFKKELEALYNLQLSQLRKELDAYIQNFADKNGLTVSDAKRRADSFDIKAFEAKAKQYVADKDFGPKANKELRDYNFSMSVGRQELLIQELELELLVLSEGERQLTNDYLMNGYKSEIVRGSLLDHTVPNKKTLERYMTTAVNANFEGAKWSERIWKRQEQLRNLVKTEVTRALIRGENGTTIAQRIRKYMDVSRTDAERLAITEHARVQTLAQQDIMKENGFEYFKLMPESRACDYCKQVGRDTEREPVPVDKMESGLNAPPMHPYCRCAVAEVYLDKQKLHKLDENGIIQVDEVITGRTPPHPVGKPRTVIQHNAENGDVLGRSFYNGDGMKYKDIHFTNHKQPDKHPFGENGEHAHDIEYHEPSKPKTKKRTTRNLTDEERKENGDVL